MTDMKKTRIGIFAFMAICMTTIGCKEQKNSESAEKSNDTIMISEGDTTLYGVCGESTSMHSVELITNEGDTMTFEYDVYDGDRSAVYGGLMPGDKLAVINEGGDKSDVARQIVNLTTLEGKWTSIDRNFEILSGGEVLSTIKSESNPWTSWKMYNGHLLLGRDTFDILNLDAEELEIENSLGIFVYKRKGNI